MRRLEGDGEDRMEGHLALVNMPRPVNVGCSMSQGSDDREEVPGTHSMDLLGFGLS